MDGGAWWATVHGLAELDMTEWLHFHFFTFIVPVLWTLSLGSLDFLGTSSLPPLGFPLRSLLASVSSGKFSSVAQLCPILCNPMDCSTLGFPVHHQPLELAQMHVHRVGDVIQPSHPLSFPSPPAFSLSKHQGLFPMSQFFASGGQSIGASASSRGKKSWQFRALFLCLDLFLILTWVILFSVKTLWRSESCLVVSDSLWPHGQLWNSLGQNTGVSSCFLLQGIFPTQVSHIAGGFFTAEPPRKPKNTGVGSLSLLQWIFLTQESNRGLLHCRQILYRLSYQESLWRGNRDEIICPENRV